MTQGYEGNEIWDTHPSFGAASSPTHSPRFSVQIQGHLVFVFGTLRQTLPLTLLMLGCFRRREEHTEDREARGTATVQAQG